MHCIILANGEIKDYEKYQALFTDAPFTICADGGIKHARKFNIIPRVVIGDLDSADPRCLERLTAQGTSVLQYPRNKDELDTELALMEAVKRGATSITLLGCSGGRLDHTLAALQLMVPVALQGISVQMLAQGHRVIVVIPGRPLVTPGEAGTILSMLPLTTCVRGITTRGVKWPLTNAVFELGKPYGVSNEVTECEVRISIEEGVLLVIEIAGGEEVECL